MRKERKESSRNEALQKACTQLMGSYELYSPVVHLSKALVQFLGCAVAMQSLLSIKLIVPCYQTDSCKRINRMVKQLLVYCCSPASLDLGGVSYGTRNLRYALAAVMLLIFPASLSW